MLSSIIRKTIIGMVCIFTSYIAYADEAAVSGFGSLSCKKVNEFYRAIPDKIENDFRHWIEGFLSGMNMSSLISGGLSKDISIPADSYLRFLRSYCDQHPLGDVLSAALNLYKTLPSNKPIK